MDRTNFRWADCCQTCRHFQAAPVATGEGECTAADDITINLAGRALLDPPFEVLAGNVCDLHHAGAASG